MPPKAKITKDMIIQASLDIVRVESQNNLNIRRIAKKLNCSTQPVMYHYQTVDELKADIYTMADKLHTEYIMLLDNNMLNPMLSIGLNYIRFAYQEKFLFQFLFQSDKFQNISFRELLESEESEILIQPLVQQTGLSVKQAKEVFETLFVCVHGFASLLANNSIEYNEEHYSALLTNLFNSLITSQKEEKNEEAI